jgi:hypothetical protein
VSIVPAFFVIDTDAERADEIASDTAIAVNTMLRNQATPNDPRNRIYLCESSPTTELEGLVPNTLEGLTCDSGSDRSATALIRRIDDMGQNVTESSIKATLSGILQMTNGWLRMRLATHPQAFINPLPMAPGSEAELTAASLLLHAYARAEAGSGNIDAADLVEAFTQAKAENPGEYEQLRILYAAQASTERGADIHEA